MQVRMLTVAANARWSARPGQLTPHLPDAEAQALIDGNYAEPKDAAKLRKAAAKEDQEAEAATLPPADETAAAGPKRRT
jgi:hypothetical protein